MDNSCNVAVAKKISNLEVTRIYLCNFLSKGELSYSIAEDAEIIKYNMGGTKFDSYIQAYFNDGNLASLALFNLGSNKEICRVTGEVLKHFLKFPLFEYNVIKKQKDNVNDQSMCKRLIVNLYKYVVNSI